MLAAVAGDFGQLPAAAGAVPTAASVLPPAAFLPPQGREVRSPAFSRILFPSPT